MPRQFPMIFYGPEGTQRVLVALGGVLRRGQPTRACQEAEACPGGLCPPRVPPRTASLLYKYPNIPETLEQAMKYSSSRRRVQNHQIQSRHHLRWGSPPPLVPLR